MQTLGLNKATLSITRPFASMDIHYNKSLNTDMKKQNETYKSEM